jgi:hypothetical protein
MVVVVVVVVVGVAGAEGAVGVTGAEGAVGVTGEEGPVDEFELPVAPIEIVASMKCIGLRTSERSCHIESRVED